MRGKGEAVGGSMTRGAGRATATALAVAALVSVGLAAPTRAAEGTSADTGSTQIVAPSYEQTLGGGLSGHAAMYPSGLDLDPNANLYIADTGDDQIQAYLSGATSTPLWVAGTRG